MGTETTSPAVGERVDARPGMAGLSRRLARAARVVAAAEATALHEEDLDPREYALLTVLIGGRLRTNQLARVMSTSGTTTRKLVDALTDRGLISRSAGRYDGRVRHVELTPAGENRIRNARAAVADAVGRLLAGAGFTDEAMARLGVLLDEIGRAPAPTGYALRPPPE
ncbi:hypothetical protein Acy02nite_91200 [Actinoplanes cyaneus]|uniref:HTH marR-type domain-containing protein n=1 Tax=Actinoplanes cyaneus TaxID=52696 RepID=A0A919MD19_9ACTN|nr:winged helix DNA-binding protein [Actinoplanes cyaneus]MCW2144389.1 DNA-binding transcriptional regulator, MarR family [Actinoplanes cyaneus]GID71239.1 hypothetical protein Acy02nite_91200 [Actinoplanes cyaneus]